MRGKGGAAHLKDLSEVLVAHNLGEEILCTAGRECQRPRTSHEWNGWGGPSRGSVSLAIERWSHAWLWLGSAGSGDQGWGQLKGSSARVALNEENSRSSRQIQKNLTILRGVSSRSCFACDTTKGATELVQALGSKSRASMGASKS